VLEQTHLVKSAERAHGGRPVVAGCMQCLSAVASPASRSAVPENRSSGVAIIKLSKAELGIGRRFANLGRYSKTKVQDFAEIQSILFVRLIVLFLLPCVLVVLQRGNLYQCPFGISPIHCLLLCPKASCATIVPSILKNRKYRRDLGFKFIYSKGGKTPSTKPINKYMNK